MHISKEFLLEAVGLSLVVALILISMQIFQRAVKVTSLLEEGQEQQLSELEEYEIVKYDGLLMDGMTVISYIKRMIGTFQLPVRVVTKEREFVVSGREEYTELRDIESEKYINPLAKYRCRVVRDENEVVTELEVKIERKIK